MAVLDNQAIAAASQSESETADATASAVEKLNRAQQHIAEQLTEKRAKITGLKERLEEQGPIGWLVGEQEALEKWVQKEERLVKRLEREQSRLEKTANKVERLGVEAGDAAGNHAAAQTSNSQANRIADEALTASSARGERIADKSERVKYSGEKGLAEAAQNYESLKEHTRSAVVMTTATVAAVAAAPVAFAAAGGAGYLALAASVTGGVAAGSVAGTVTGAVSNVAKSTLEGQTVSSALSSADDTLLSDTQTAAMASLAAVPGLGAAAKLRPMIAGHLPEVLVRGVTGSTASVTGVVANKLVNDPLQWRSLQTEFEKQVAGEKLTDAQWADRYDKFLRERGQSWEQWAAALPVDFGVGVAAGFAGGASGAIRENVGSEVLAQVTKSSGRELLAQAARAATIRGGVRGAETTADLGIGLLGAALRADATGVPLTFDSIAQEVSSSIVSSTLGDVASGRVAKLTQGSTAQPDSTGMSETASRNAAQIERLRSMMPTDELGQISQDGFKIAANRSSEYPIDGSLSQKLRAGPIPLSRESLREVEKIRAELTEVFARGEQFLADNHARELWPKLRRALGIDTPPVGSRQTSRGLELGTHLHLPSDEVRATLDYFVTSVQLGRSLKGSELEFVYELVSRIRLSDPVPGIYPNRNAYAGFSALTGNPEIDSLMPSGLFRERFIDGARRRPEIEMLSGPQITLRHKQDAELTEEDTLSRVGAYYSEADDRFVLPRLNEVQSVAERIAALSAIRHEVAHRNESAGEYMARFRQVAKCQQLLEDWNLSPKLAADIIGFSSRESILSSIARAYPKFLVVDAVMEAFDGRLSDEFMGHFIGGDDLARLIGESRTGTDREAFMSVMTPEGMVDSEIITGFFRYHLRTVLDRGQLIKDARLDQNEEATKRYLNFLVDFLNEYERRSPGVENGRVGDFLDRFRIRR